MPTGQSHNVAGHPVPAPHPLLAHVPGTAVLTQPWSQTTQGESWRPGLHTGPGGGRMMILVSNLKFLIFIWQYRIPTLEEKNLNIECRNSAPTPLLLCHTLVTPPRYHPETGWTERVLIILCIPIVTYLFLMPEGQHNYTCPKGKTALAEGRSPPQELEVGPRSGPYLLVTGNSAN